MNAPRFGCQPVRHRTVRATSREAFAQRASTLSQRILAHLASVPNATDAEMEAALGASHQALSGDRRHLVERGKVRPSGAKRPTPSGRPAIAWELGTEPRVDIVVEPSGQVTMFRSLA